jgi:hypothetical protein
MSLVMLLEGLAGRKATPLNSFLQEVLDRSMRQFQITRSRNGDPASR